jgi:hypothetical protein
VVRADNLTKGEKMNKIFKSILVLAAFGPAVGSACPDLSGKYDCGGLGILLSVSDAGSSFDFSLTAPFSANPGAFKGGGYSLSKTGGLTASLEGVGYRNLNVTAICEGNVDLKLDADFNDPVAGQTHLTKHIYKDAQGNLRKSSIFTFANGSFRNGIEEFCGAR